MCRRTREDDELQRAGRTPDGMWYLGRGPGRGAWWCRSGPCGERLGASALARALRAPLGPAEVEALRDEVARASVEE
ncbi:MAG: DUF448 domain-containing protein [Acidimicrobiales bacterium]